MKASNFRIGIDVGGTNTDAVVMRGRTVCAACKTPTTADVGAGIQAALREVLQQGQLTPAQVRAVMIGTTHFTNAFVQARDLARVGVIRLAAPASVSLPPFVDWPHALREAVAGPTFIVRGGYNFDGAPIAAPNEQELAEAAASMRASGVQSVAISSVFAPVNDAQERCAETLVRAAIPDCRITRSADIGRIGLLERENAAIMNASLAALADGVVRSFADSLAALGLDCPFYISQNDGSLMAPQVAQRFPVLTFAS